MSKKRMSFLIVAMAFMAVLFTGTYFGAWAQGACGCGFSLSQIHWPCLSCSTHHDLDAEPWWGDTNRYESREARLDTAMGVNPYTTYTTQPYR
jgi:hypothetical protein